MREQVAEILEMPLQTESPEELYKQLAQIESLAFKVCQLQSQTEVSYQKSITTLSEKKSEVIPTITGTAIEKQVKLDALCKDEIEASEKLKTQVDFWKRTGRLIENKVSLGQSILSNITSQVKAGLYFNNVK